MIEIKLDGVPIGKGRPRFSRATGAVYTPEKTARFEERLAWGAQAVMAGRPLCVGPLRVTVQAWMPIPSSKPKKWKADALNGLIHPVTKPDADNFAKCLDALNNVVWRDDSQIVSLMVTKHYTDRPCLRIWVEELT
jgi:Holliday junction resolvase RusA-like endonuclease